MRHRQFKLKMGLRGRSVFVTYMVIAITAILALYYVWNSLFFAHPSRVTYASAQGVKQEDVDKWDRQRLEGFVIEEPPVGLNKEIEMQLANEKWKKAKALQDRIDEERLLEEQAAEHTAKKIDSNIQQMRGDQRENSHQQKEGMALKTGIFQQTDPLDGDYFSKLERLVHLDLKGAPPLVSYLERLFPILRKLGATGLLMEYEDMFPYTGNISLLASGNAYSLSDLQRIQAAAKANSLEIIPLVQTFGHMEFVLKYKRFIDLRENEYTPQVITPVKEESYNLIFNILEQVLKAHPDTKRIHLGCDEVYQLGKGQSLASMTSQRLTPQKLFLRHVFKVAGQVRKAFPAVTPLIWDDWLRGIPYDVMADSGLPGLVEPVVWYYQHNILDQINPSVWDNYGRLFPAVWVASAFKGATGSAQILTNASVHLDNNLQWVNIVRSFGIQAKKVSFRGIILTGWQRYDHFATLCELLPVGLPSLALSLQAVSTGGFGSKDLTFASRSLNCSGMLDLQFPPLLEKGAKVSQDCSFPGSSIFYSVQQLWGIMKVYQQDLGLQERVSGWMTDYHSRQGISNPGQMKVLAHKLTKVVDKLQGMVSTMRNNLLQVYDKDTVEEWIATNLQDRSVNIKQLLDKANHFLERKDWPARPFIEHFNTHSQIEIEPGAQNAGALTSNSMHQGDAGSHGVYGQQNLNPKQDSTDAKLLQVVSHQKNINPPVDLHGLARMQAVNFHKAVGLPQLSSGKTGQVSQNQGVGTLSPALLQNSNVLQQVGPNPKYLSPTQNHGMGELHARPLEKQAGLAINAQGPRNYARGRNAPRVPQKQEQLPQGGAQQGLPVNLQGLRPAQPNLIVNGHNQGKALQLPLNAQNKENPVMKIAGLNQPNAQVQIPKKERAVHVQSNNLDAFAKKNGEAAGYLDSFIGNKENAENVAPSRREFHFQGKANRPQNVDYNAEDDS